MESVILIAHRRAIPNFKARVSSALRVVDGVGGALVIDNGAARIYVALDEHVRSELGAERLERILSIVEDPVFFTVDFSDIDLCKTVLMSIADDPRLLVDNDHGVLLSGSEFVRVLRSQRDWDWRRDTE